MADRMVIIRHRDGSEFGILPKDFDKVRANPETEEEPKTYAELGYKIVSWQDGEEYDGPKTASRPARASGGARRRAARQRTTAAEPDVAPSSERNAEDAPEDIR